MPRLQQTFFVTVEAHSEKVDPGQSSDIAKDWITEAVEARPEVVKCSAVAPRHYVRSMLSAAITRIENEVATSSHAEASGKRAAVDKLAEIRDSI